MCYTDAQPQAGKRHPPARADAIVEGLITKSFALLVYTSQLHLLQNAPWFQAVRSGLNVFLETNSTHTLVAAARAGVGIAVLPPFVARNYDDLIAVSEPVAEQEVWLVTHPESRRDPKVRVTARAALPRDDFFFVFTPRLPMREGSQTRRDALSTTGNVGARSREARSGSGDEHGRRGPQRRSGAFTPCAS